MYEKTDKGVRVSDYRGVVRYVEYVGMQHIQGRYLKAFYNIYHFEVENVEGLDMEVPSVDFKNKRVELTATNDIGVYADGSFWAKNEVGFLDKNGNVITVEVETENLDEHGNKIFIVRPAIAGEASILKQLELFESTPISPNEANYLEIKRADQMGRFNKAINGIDVLEL